MLVLVPLSWPNFSFFHDSCPFPFTSASISASLRLSSLSSLFKSCSCNLTFAKKKCNATAEDAMAWNERFIEVYKQRKTGRQFCTSRQPAIRSQLTFIQIEANILFWSVTATDDWMIADGEAKGELQKLVKCFSYARFCSCHLFVLFSVLMKIEFIA